MFSENVSKESKIETKFLGYYLKWVPQENFYYAVENTGFEVNKKRTDGTYQKYASIDDKTDGFFYYTAYIKFGYGRTTDHASKDIRSGIMTRQDAIDEVLKRDHIKSKDLQRWLKYVEMSEEEFDFIADTYRDERVWFIIKNKWCKYTLDGDIKDYGKVHLPVHLRGKYYKKN